MFNFKKSRVVTCFVLAGTLVCGVAYADTVYTDNHVISANAAAQVKVGNLPNYDSATYGGIMLKQASDYALLMSTSGTFINAPGSGSNVHIRAGNVEIATFGQGGVTIDKPTTFNETGGNVPHACRLAIGNAGVATVSCNAGEIATGGGAYCATGTLTQSKPESSMLDGWTAGCSSGGPATFAICCAY